LPTFSTHASSYSDAFFQVWMSLIGRFLFTRI